MADSVRPRKRRRGEGNCSRKLDVHDKVEVKSVEDGFQGSWHPGRITRCADLVREVRYDHLLCDNKSGYLTDCIKVSCALDGMDSGSEALVDYYGRIRPTAPSILIPDPLPYGLCVDAYHADAWWEGVVFDHEVTSQQRNIFFPDLGDEHCKELNDLRPTHDWNEVTEWWKPRGKWSFLEVIEDFERVYFFPVSVKQMWYDVREMEKCRHLLHWSYSVKSFWQELIMEALDANMKLTIDELLRVSASDSSEGLVENIDLSSAVQCASPRQSLVQADDVGSLGVNIRMKDEANLEVVEGGKLSTGSMHSCPPSTSPSPCNLVAHPKASSVIPTHRTRLLGDHDFNDKKGTCLSNSRMRHPKPSRYCWSPAGFDVVPGAVLCHESITQYAASSENERLSVEVTKRCRMHLKCLGWEIEFTRDGGQTKFRYISPQGEVHYSLRYACQKIKKLESENRFLITKTESKRVMRTSKPQSNKLLGIAKPDPENECDRSDLKTEVPFVEPKYCAKAITDYIFAMKKCTRPSQMKNADYLVEKAKQQLAAMGWSFWYHTKKGRQELRYDSPKQKTYYSLLTACKGYLAEQYGDESSFESHSDGEPPTTGSWDKEISSWPEQHSEFIEPGKFEFLKTKNIQKRKQNEALHLYGPSLHSQAHTSLLADEDSQINWARKRAKFEGIRERSTTLPSNKREISVAVRKTRKDADRHPVARVLRSSKRAREVVSSSLSQQAPRTVLSWLIDNNAILPRAKVHCCRGKGHEAVIEGRVTRDGIKCSCCQKIFTISGFEAHAGHRGHSPAANIFLEDGMSLAECQIQIMRDSVKRFPKDPLERLQHRNHRQSTNDYICSLCHYGGTLILCDHCPSSFHASCLSLQDVPEGDWFCPSCCCGICGRSLFDENKDKVSNSSVLCCHQCERRFHMDCLRNTGANDLGSRREWFCCGSCEQIHKGLQTLVGRPIPVGSDDLTWTLVKPMRYEIEDIDGPNSETVADNFIRLSLALDVMHECFEPVKEARTRRDLVEDVIFCRGSELNRLNFRGFYTVLLERNEEMITAATIRVYGDKVAEVPLVGTRFQYRRLGMCRILIHELEKRLVELGVERLVLPAVPNVLNTWTASFGFSQMTESERSQFLAYTFLDFQGTVMCQKMLQGIPLPEAIKSRAICDEPNKSAEGEEENADLGENNTVCEVSQGEDVENQIVDRERVKTSTENAAASQPLSFSEAIINLEQHLVPCNSEDTSASPFNDATPMAQATESADHKPEPGSSKDVAEKSVDCGGDHLQDKKADGDNPLQNKKVDGDVKCYQRKKTLERRPSNVEVSCR